jgi:hypothetical protein
MPAKFELTHALMGCCGVAGGYNFNAQVQHGTIKTLGGYEYPKWRDPTKEEIEERFDKLVTQHDAEGQWFRNCLVIFLSERQKVAIEIALSKGFVKVQEFYNPNSHNMVGLYTKVLVADYDGWLASAAYKRRYGPDEDYLDEDDEGEDNE